MIEIPKIASPVALRIEIEVDSQGLARIVKCGDPRFTAYSQTGQLGPVDILTVAGVLVKMGAALIENRPRGNSGKEDATANQESGNRIRPA